MRTRPTATVAQLEELAERITFLAETVSGPGSCTVGPNVTEEPLDQGYRFGFVIRFSNRCALDAYHVNPAHLPVSLTIRDLSEVVLVFDFTN